MAANKLLGLAMANPGQSAGYLGQAAQINPGAVMALEGQQARNQYLQAQGQAMQQKAAQTQQEGAAKKIRGAALYMESALKSGDPMKIEGAYQAVRPYLAELGQAQGKVPPPQWDPNMAAGIQQVLAQTAYLDNGAGTPAQIQTFRTLSQNLSPADQEKARRIALGLDPRQSSAALKYMAVLGPDGRTRIVAMDPREVGATIVAPGTGGAQNGMGVGQAVPGAGAGAAPQATPASSDQVVAQIAARATQMVRSGQMSADQASQWVTQQLQASGVQFTPAGGDSVAQASQVAPQAGNPLTSPTQSQQAFNTESGKQAAQTIGEQARIPVEAAAAAAQVTAKGQAQRKLDAPLAREKLSGVTSGYDRMIDSVDQILNSPGLERAVGLGSYVPGIRGGSKTDAEALITTLKSQIGFNVLQNMRDMSKTGGALGQISDKEEELLQNNLAALSTAQSPAQFRDQLQRIKQFAEASKARMQVAYDNQYGQPAAAPQSSGPTAVNPQTGERVQWNGSAWVPVQ
jgi:hypothetical protein